VTGVVSVENVGNLADYWALSTPAILSLLSFEALIPASLNTLALNAVW